ALRGCPQVRLQALPERGKVGDGTRELLAEGLCRAAGAGTCLEGIPQANPPLPEVLPDGATQEADQQRDEEHEVERRPQQLTGARGIASAVLSRSGAVLGVLRHTGRPRTLRATSRAISPAWA